MSAPGDRRLPSPAESGRAYRSARRSRPRSGTAAVGMALLIAVLGAVAWAVLKGVLEFPGALAVAVVAGWAMGAMLREMRAASLLAAIVAAAAWALGLVLTWLLAMAILPASSRTFFERLETTPLLGWLSPQLGFIEGAGLVLYVLAALWGARRRSGA